MNKKYQVHCSETQIMNDQPETDEPDDDKTSSYQKGINNILEDVETYEALIWEYVLRVNSNFYSKEFPTTQIAKIILDRLNIEKTRFPIFHKVIRIILANWATNGLCERVRRTRSSGTKKTKVIYRFNEEGLGKIKAKFIDKCISDIINEDALKRELQVLKTREKIIDDLNFYLSEMNEA